MQRIRNVVFDMGGVLLDWNPFGIACAFAENDADARMLSHAVFEQPAWSWGDAGAVDEETIAWLARQQLPERLHAIADEMVQHWYDGRTWHPAANDLARRLAQTGYGVYLLTNAGPAFRRYCTRIPAWDVFSGVVVSCEEHLLKPDARIFKLLCDRYALNPAECLFVDDTQVNVLGAERMGMQGFHYQGDASALEAFIARNA